MVKKDLLLISVFISVIALWYFVVTLWQPTASIMVDAQPYRPILWFISLAALAIPLSLYLTDTQFKSLPNDRKILLLGLAFLTTSMVHSLRCFIDTQFFFFLTTIVYFVRHRQYRKPTWEYWFVVAYIVWNLITLLWTPDLRFGFKYARNFIPMLAYPLMFLSFTLTSDELNGLLKLFWRVALMAVLLSFLSGIYEITVLRTPVSELFHLRITMLKDSIIDANGVEQYTCNMLYGWSGNGHPSYNALWAVAASISGFYLLRHRLITYVEYLFGFFSLLALQFSAQSRIGIVMLILSFLAAFFYLLNAKANTKVKANAIAISLLAVIFLLFLTYKPTIFSAYHNDVARSIIWDSAIQVIRLKPLTGTGLGGTTQQYVTSLLGHPWPGLYFENIYAHNQFLGDWMQSGVVGFILSIAIVILTFVMSVRRRSYTAFAYTLAILLFMFIEMPLRFIQGTTLITFFLCLFLHKIQSPKELS